MTAKVGPIDLGTVSGTTLLGTEIHSLKKDMTWDAVGTLTWANIKDQKTVAKGTALAKISKRF
jgi:hypothetical protein